MFFCGLGILGYINYQTSLHEYKFLIEMNLNLFTIFYLIVQRRPNFQSLTNQHLNVIEITIVAVKNSF